MDNNKENILTRLLKWIGIIKEHKISKSEICKNAQNICDYNCDTCAWAESEVEG